ncbi:hypothetical protein P7F88_02995 [Vibrio hannami]|uniref:hypothetical protein n=1 Tax=Vibrio hannami TaxID=2717094 RepID=UPI00240EC41D|nr:hypothetical protein [Vibrio hannami]MDG3085119.1 hypothetical protein [Vibrio hannami]
MVNAQVDWRIVNVTTGEWAPYTSQNLPHGGLANHIVSEAFSAVGIKTNFGFFPWRRSYLYVKNGQDDKKKNGMHLPSGYIRMKEPKN